MRSLIISPNNVPYIFGSWNGSPFGQITFSPTVEKLLIVDQPTLKELVTSHWERGINEGGTEQGVLVYDQYGTTILDRQNNSHTEQVVAASENEIYWRDLLDLYGSNRLSPDSSLLTGNTGNWNIVGDGAMSAVDKIDERLIHPINPSTSMLEFLPQSVDDYIYVQPEGPFYAGVTYEALIFYKEATEYDGRIDFAFGDVENTDFALNNVNPSEAGTPNLNEGQWVGLSWTPETYFGNAALKVTYVDGTPSGSILWLAYAFVAERKYYPVQNRLDVTGTAHGTFFRVYGFRVTGRGEDIHFSANEDMRLYAGETVQIESADVIRMYAPGNTYQAFGKMLVDEGIGVGNSASATTPGTVTKKIEIFDYAGASLGFIAVYDAIT